LLDSECEFCKAFCLGFATFTKGLGAAVLKGLATLTGDAALEELYLAVLIADSVALFSYAPFTLLASYSFLPHYLIKISHVLDGPSWGILLMNAGEVSEMDPYEEPYVDDAPSTAESPGYIADSNSIEEDTDEDSIDYPDEPKNGEEDDDEDPEEDPSEKHEPEDEDTKEEDPSEGSDETEQPQTPMAAFSQALIDAFAARSPLFPLPPNNLVYDQAPLETSAAARAPKGQYDFVDTVVQTIARAADRAKDVGYVRDLQAFEHKMMTSIKEVNLRICYQAQVRSKSQMTAYETELQEVRQAYLSSVARNKALLARLETLKTHMSRMEWQRQSAKDLVAERQNDNKRKSDDSSRNKQQPHKKENVARAYTVGPGEKKAYTENLPLCTKCNYHHTGQCAPKCRICKRHGHPTNDCWVNMNNNNNNNKNQKVGACYECGDTGHIKKNCPKLKNRGNGNGNGVAHGRDYDFRGRDASPDSNIIMGIFLLDNRYATILFDTGAYRSFVSTTFSALIDITPTTLENYYDVELANGKIIGVNTIIRCCTLNFMNYPFNTTLMPVPLGSLLMYLLTFLVSLVRNLVHIKPSSWKR
nr:hypothetical protein [Tanacetum cinerariifolium]